MAAPVSPRYGDGYGAVSPLGTRYADARRVHPPTGQMSVATPRLAAIQQPPLSPRGDRNSLKMSPRWPAPTITPRLHPDQIASAVRESTYVRAAKPIKSHYEFVIAPAPAPAAFGPTPRELGRKRAAAARAAKDAEKAEKEAEAARAANDAAVETARAAAAQTYEYSTTEEEEEGDSDEMDDAFDEQMLMMARNRGNNRGSGGDRRMSLADMKGADMRAGLAKLREQLTPLEVDEYRDFFDLVDEDNSNSIDSTELQQVRTRPKSPPRACVSPLRAVFGAYTDTGLLVFRTNR